MGRRRKYEERTLHDSELEKRFEETLRSLVGLCVAYDQGAYEVYGSIATEIYKLFNDGSGSKIRNKYLYTSLAAPVDKSALSQVSPLVSVRSTSLADGTGTISHEPMALGWRHKRENMKFSIWWERDVVYLGGHTPFGMDPTMIPIGAAQLPYNKREKLTRREVIQLVRNKLGAHISKDVPLKLDHLFDRKSWGNIVASAPSHPNEDPEEAMKRDKVLNKPIHAMVRHIAEEVLVSTGIRSVA